MSGVHRPTTYFLVTSGSQGPPGPPGKTDDMYARRADIGSNVLYRGEAAIGSEDEDPVWRIRKIDTLSNGDIIERWADGHAQFTHAWSDRLIKEYI